MYFIFGILTSFLFYSILKPFLKRYAKDLPNNRSSHNREVPTAGGLIFVIPIMGYYFYSGNWNFVEWPDKIKPLLPNNTTTVKLSILSNQERELEWI